MHTLADRLSQDPSPLVEVRAPEFEVHDIRLYIKRDDLLHPEISGNKWRKLKYNLLEASWLGYDKLLTFGGAYSNHLAATAAAGKAFGFSTLGVVRGERVMPLNPTLKYVEGCGMELKFINRSNFRQKNRNSILEAIKINPNAYYILPEGGSNCLALKGSAEMVAEVRSQLGTLPDYTCVACGTGATMAGIIAGQQGAGRVVGVSVLKGDFMQGEVESFLDSCGPPGLTNWEVRTNYHFGGYAKFKPELITFINQFKSAYGIPLDPIYTGKLFYAAFDLVRKGFFKKGSTVVLVHTGGLQGIEGFNERFNKLLNC